MRKNFLKKILTGAAMFSVASMLFLSCAKDGKDGLTGATGANGLDANQTCKLCHNPAMVDSVSAQFMYSKHDYGTTSESEAGNTGCGPCHLQEAFKYVCNNNVPVAFVQDPLTGKWSNPYASASYAAYGKISCYTCHDKLHTTYGLSDLTTFTTVAPVPMTMWGGAKTINLTQGGGKSNLCVKCHQPRPLAVGTTGISGGDGRLFPYDSLKNYPGTILWDSTAGATQYYLVPAYRTHVHYGPVSAVYAGMGGIEFTGASGYLQYTNSKHTTVATCQDCHMAPMTGQAGGHSFRVRNNNNSNSGLTSSTTFNFNGCNTVACHGAPGETAMSSVSGNQFVTTRATVKALLDTLANHINLVGGGNTHPILHMDATTGTGLVTNLWLGVSSKNYDGYLDIYDSPTGSNPNGYWVTTTTVPTGKAKLPTLKFVHMGAIINFQFCLREYSLGIHNTNYVKALLTNSIQALKDAGY